MLVDKFTGEILEDKEERLVVGHGGMYSAFPIPAYQILIKADLHAAKDVLVCLVSHLGEGTNTAWPSYSTIAKEAKKGRNTVSKALKDLHEYGFVRSYTWHQGPKRKRNKYYIQRACYNHSLMNQKALSHLPIVTRCLFCGKALTKVEFASEGDKFAHWGCSGAIGTKFGKLRNE
jgi:hypothetical protein